MTRAATAATTTGRAARTCAAAVAALLTAGLLTACSDSESPQGDPPSSTTATTPETGDTDATSSPDPSEPDVDKPERPAAMDKKNADGAAAAAEYFLSLRSYVLSTGDTTEWRAMSYKTCGYCRSAMDQSKTIAKEGDKYEGGEISADITKRYKRDEATGIWPMDASVKEEAIEVTDKSGKEIFSADTALYESRIEIGLIDDEWIVVEVADVPEG